MGTVEVVKNVLVGLGAGWVLWLLFALSAASVAISIERWLFFRRKRADVRALADLLDEQLKTGSFTTAIGTLQAQTSTPALVASAGLRLRDWGAEAAEKAMRGILTTERQALEIRLAYLGTLGNNAPFIGLFGTVIGIILAFEELGQATATGGAATQAATAGVMRAIAEALVATAVGIGVALPAVAAYNFFQRQMAMLLDDAEALINLVLAHMVSLSHRLPDRPTGTVPQAPSPMRDAFNEEAI
jgi:biopolymer transport protein ExbB